MAPPQPPAVQVIVRPVSRLVVSNGHPSTSAHPAAIRDRATDSSGSRRGRPAIEATSRDTEVIDKPVPQREPHTSVGEPSLLKVIDQQTCDGAYLPGPVGGPLSPNRWLNMVRAKFFREADGTRWLKFYLNGSDPVNLPVTVTDKEVNSPLPTILRSRCCRRASITLQASRNALTGRSTSLVERHGAHPLSTL